MKPRVLIFSYWTEETDLAALLGGWPEFAGGEGYAVDLRGAPGEAVEIRLIHENDDRWLLLSATSMGTLFERVLGRVAIEMARSSQIHVCTVDTPEAPSRIV
jgi:hypothetical protein